MPDRSDCLQYRQVFQSIGVVQSNSGIEIAHLFENNALVSALLRCGGRESEPMEQLLIDVPRFWKD